MLKIISNVALIKIVGAAAFFCFQVVLAKMLGAEGMGIFLLVMMVATIISTMARLGMENPLLRFVATASSEARWIEVHEVYRISIRAALLSSIVGAAFIILYVILGDIFKLGLGLRLLWAVPLLFIMTLCILQAQALQGIGSSYWGSAIQQAIPMGIGLLLAPFLITIWDVNGAFLAVCFGWLISFIIGMYCWKDRIPAISSELYKGKFAFKTLWQASSPLILATIITQLNQWMIIGMAGILLSHEMVGKLGVAQRCAMVVNLILGSVNIVTNPKYAIFYHKREIGAMAHLARKMALLMMLVSFPIFLLASYYRESIMLFFGVNFSEASIPFVILMVGQLINASCGSVGFILMMSGFELAVRNTIVWTFIVSSIMHYMLISSFGMIGAAIASSFAVVFWNVLMSWHVWRKLGFVPFPLIPRLVYNLP